MLLSGKCSITESLQEVESYIICRSDKFVGSKVPYSHKYNRANRANSAKLANRANRANGTSRADRATRANKTNKANSA